MTRKDLLAARANDVVEAALSQDVCLSEVECTIVREVVLAELMRVEREVWEKVATYCHDLHNDGYTRDDVAGCGNEDDIALAASNDEDRTIEHWCREQQRG